MLFIHIALLALVVCLHVVGGAVGFRTLFPRESPWWGFFLPTLTLVSLLNFIEHFVALPSLEWLLPFTAGGLCWLMFRPGAVWKGLWLPISLFVVSFACTLLVKCIQPDINFYCTEGLTDTNRILDFCLGDKVPPQDCWLPPYPHVGYYTFMQYGASVLKRLLAVDIGTAYNLSSALVSAFSLLAAAAAAHTISRYRNWVAILTLVIVAGGFTGSTPIDAVLNPMHPNPCASTDIGSGDPTDIVHKEFFPLLRRAPPDIAYRLFTPGCYIYYSEFHATMGGHLLALLSVFGVAEVLRRRRSVVPWIYLALAPSLSLITCTWFFIIVSLLCAPALVLAWALGRQPVQWRYAIVGAIVGTALLWPDIENLCQGAAPETFCWSLDITLDFWTVVIQWWPIYIPWFALGFAWRRLTTPSRFFFLILIPIWICVEAFYFTDRGTTLEKTWGGTFGVAMASLYPTLFTQRGWLYRGLSVVIILTGLISLSSWIESVYTTVDRTTFLRLSGDNFIKRDPQMVRMEEVLSRIRGKMVLTGESTRAWFEAPCLPAFTENRCYLGWANAEETAGHPVEANDRQAQENAFYDGTLPSPLLFLQSNGISAVLVWPDDKMSQAWLDKMKIDLAPDYIYFDCKGEGPHPAGVFLLGAASRFTFP